MTTYPLQVKINDDIYQISFNRLFNAMNLQTNFYFENAMYYFCTKTDKTGLQLVNTQTTSLKNKCYIFRKYIENKAFFFII